MQHLEHCPLCRSSSWTTRHQFVNDLIAECSECGLVFSSVKNIRTEIYNGDYYSGSGFGYDNYEGERKTHLLTFNRRLERAEEKLGSTGSLIDYGAAYGHLLAAGIERGWHVVGTDIAFDAVKKAKKTYGAPLFLSDFHFPVVRARLFDLACLYDVIEHTNDPLAVLVNVSSVLNSHGLLHITTPNVGSLSQKILQKSWYHYKPSEHLVYFSFKTLQNALERCGYRTVELAPAPSQMTLHDIIVRLHRYADRPIELLNRVIGHLGLADHAINIYIGEMEAWAKVKSDVDFDETLIVDGMDDASVYSSLLQCGTCTGKLTLEKWPQYLSCKHCQIGYEVIDGIPIMLPSKAIRLASCAS